MQQINEIIAKARAFEKEAHAILGFHEAAASRVVTLADSYRRLQGLSLRQDDLFRQGLRCAENALYRAAIVMAWAAFVDYLEEKLASDGFKKLKAARPKWNFTTIEELRERYPELQIIEVCKDVGLCSNTEMRALVGLLSKRNECAHPSNYSPGLNETLGYISELFRRIATLQTKNP